jgi:two-component system, OmpR family, sensor kinase
LKQRALSHRTARAKTGKGAGRRGSGNQPTLQQARHNAACARLIRVNESTHNAAAGSAAPSIRGVNRLFWKILIALWLTLLAAALGVTAALQMYRRAQHAERTQAIDGGPRSRALLDAAESTLRFGGTQALKALLAAEAARSRDDVFAVDDAGRDLLLRPVPAEARAAAQKEAERRAADLPARSVQSPDGVRLLLFIVRGRGEKPGSLPTAGPGEAAASAPLRRPHGEPGVRTPGRPPPPGPSIAVLGASAALVSLLFAAALAWYMTRPIRKLQWAFDAASKGKLETRVQHLMGRRRDEIADLGVGFDQMAQKVQSLVAAQQRLLHDVSHELRSPLARLQAATDLARQSPDRTADSLDRIDREIARLDQLTGQMLTLSRLEAGVQAHEPTDFDFAELVTGVVEDARFEAQAQQRDVLCRTPGAAPVAVPVTMREEMIHRAVENVIRNAVKFTAAGTAVEVTLGSDADMVWLEVADRGPGAAEAELAALFEPFHRGANARGVDGHGLGLAIARHAVRQHVGTIAARQRDGGGLVIRIELPRRAA